MQRQKGVAFIHRLYLESERDQRRGLAKWVEGKNGPDPWPHQHLSHDSGDSDLVERSGGGRVSAPFANFHLYDLRVYTLRKVHRPHEAGLRVVIGYLKSEVWKVCEESTVPENYESCLDELHRRKGAEFHRAFAAIISSGEMIERKTHHLRCEYQENGSSRTWLPLPKFAFGEKPERLDCHSNSVQGLL
jgi:hypothetical protein